MFPPFPTYTLPVQSAPPVTRIPSTWQESPLKHYFNNPNFEITLFIEGLEILDNSLTGNSVFLDPLPRISRATQKTRSGVIWSINNQKYYAITDLLNAVGFPSTDRGEINGILIYSSNKLGLPSILSKNFSSSFKSEWVVVNSKFNVKLNEGGEWKLICTGELYTRSKRWLKLTDTRGIVYATLIVGDGIPRTIDDKFPGIERTAAFADIDIFRTFYNMMILYKADPFYAFGNAVAENASP